MTNPTPDYGYQVKFDSVQDNPHHSHPQAIEKLSLVTRTAVEGALQDALLSPETVVLETSFGMKANSSNAPTNNKPLSNGIIKTTTTAGEKRNNNKRKLTFKVDDKDEVIEDIYTYPFPSDVDDNEVWWMDDELDQLLTEAMMVADHYTRKRKDWQNKIKSIMKTVMGCSSKKKESAPAKLKASDLDFVVDSDARGLELYIHPIFQKNREKAVRGVVKVQEEYNASEKKKGKTDPELRLKVLRAQSLKLTNLARLMAKTLADGDRRAANKDDVDSTNAVPASTASSEELVKSEELERSMELEQSEELQTATAAPRPRTRSPMRGTIIPTNKQGLQYHALQELQEQDKERMNPPNMMEGAGGIGSLKAALAGDQGED